MKATEDTAVKFDPQPLQVAESPIYAAGADDASAFPTTRTSRHIDFMDDGKLFEGHFTLHTRSLKNMIQLLVDQQSEQRVIINDLQDQMNTLRQQATKMKRVARVAPTTSSRDGSDDIGEALKELEDLRHRVKVLEGFKSLWGIRSEEIESLVSRYGDPVVTPEEYTACLLNLQAFRVMRNETRNSVVSLVDSRTSTQGRPMSPEKPVKTRPTRDPPGRETSRVARDDDSRTPQDDGTRAGRDESRESRGARGGRADREESRADRNTREESRADRNTREESRGGRTDRNTREESRADRNTREESRADRNTREESRGGRADREESRADRNTREESRADRNTREESRGGRAGRDESRGTRNTREESRADRDESRGSRNTRDRHTRGDDSREVREDDVRESRAASPHTVDSTGGESLGQLASRLDALERKLRRGSAGGYFAPRQSSSSPTEMVDEQARQDLEELERFVVRRFKELDRMLSKPRDSSQGASMRSSSHSPARTEKAHERAPLVSSESNNNINANNKNSGGSTDVSKNQDSTNESKLRKDRKVPTGGPVIDQTARDDASAALDRLDSLEKFVTRKIKDLSVAIGKDLGPVSIRPSGETEVPPPVDRRPQGPMVDQMARDDAARSLEMIQELEEDLGKRWQSLEERLRIIGRATMGRGSISPATGGGGGASSSIDRKAREDASMSLMRIQQLEREIIGFRRLLQKHRILDAEEAELGDPRGFGGGGIPMSPSRLLRQAAPLPPAVSTDKTGAPADAYHDARMQMLEQEVEQRMSEVNRALATLRSTQPDSGYSNIRGTNDYTGNGGPLMGGQIIINSSETGGIGSQGIGVPFPTGTTTEAGVLVVTSRESPSRTPVKIVEGAPPDVLQLRPPQLGALGAPLVTRDLHQGGKSVTPSNVLSFTTGAAKSEGEINNKLQNSISAAEAAISTTAGRPGESALSTSREVGGNSLTADASKNGTAADGSTASAAESQTLRNIKLSLGENGQAISRDRTGELNQLRSHSTRLRDMSMSSRGRIENNFSTEPSALGHTTPCVVYNCAWCAAQKRTISARAPRSLR